MKYLALIIFFSGCVIAEVDTTIVDTHEFSTKVPKFDGTVALHLESDVDPRLYDFLQKADSNNIDHVSNLHYSAKIHRIDLRSANGLQYLNSFQVKIEGANHVVFLSNMTLTQEQKSENPLRLEVEDSSLNDLRPTFTNRDAKIVVDTVVRATGENLDVFADCYVDVSMDATLTL